MISSYNIHTNPHTIPIHSLHTTSYHNIVYISSPRSCQQQYVIFTYLVFRFDIGASVQQCDNDLRMTVTGSDIERSPIILVQRTREEERREEKRRKVVLEGDRYETQHHKEIVCIHTQQYIRRIRFVKLSKVTKVNNTSLKTLIRSEQNFEDNIEASGKNKKNIRNII